VLEIQCFHGIGAFEVYRLKVSALKLSDPSVCSVLRRFGFFPNYDTISKGGEGGLDDFRFRTYSVDMKVLELLNWSTNFLGDYQIENPRLNAELLLARSLNLSREGLYMNLQNQLKEEEKEALERLIQRRISGEPLQYILEYQEFWSMGLKVDTRVLIPRPETELLVEQSLLILSETRFKRTPFVLEIGTGSGAIAMAIAKERKDAFLVATDLSRDALLLAKENARSVGVQHQIEFVNGDLFEPFSVLKKKGPFDLILSNPPYINRHEIRTLAKEVKDYEPIMALDGGEDGLEFYRRIVSQAHLYLGREGWLLVEVGQGQSLRVSKLMEEGGHFLNPECVPDLSGIERVLKAQRKEKIRSTCLRVAPPPEALRRAGASAKAGKSENL
jgi:release factor glutamine methyltransferase